ELIAKQLCLILTRSLKGCCRWLYRMNERTWRQKWRWLFAVLAILSLSWAIWLLWEAIPDLAENFDQLKPGWLLFVLALNMLSGYLAFEVFRILFMHMQPETYQRADLAHLYFIGQLMKHIPGRFWSIAYQ